MEHVSIKEFASSLNETLKKPAFNGSLVLTDEGVPTMLVVDITGKDIPSLVNYIKRHEALEILQKVQISSVRNGTDKLSMEEIDAEISAYRREAKTVV